MKWPQTLALACLPLVLVAAGVGHALAAAPLDAQSAEESGREPRGVEALDWMAGAWQGPGLGGAVEEHWSAPAGGSLIGMFRLVQHEETSFTQYMLIEEEAGGVVLRFQHFNPGYEPWEKAGPLSFDLTDSSAGRAVFESPDPKQVPARLVYSARGADAMSVAIESPEALGGPISFEILLKRSER
jgi:hypothetical protein